MAYWENIIMCSNLKITIDEHGMFIVNGEKNNSMAHILTALVAYLAEIFLRKYKIEDSQNLALKVVLEGTIEEEYILIYLPPQIKEVTGEKKWRIPFNISQMNSFYSAKMRS